VTPSPRCLCRHRLRQARADQVERIIATSYGGALALSEGEVRKIQSLDGLTRSTLESAISDLAAAGRVTFEPVSSPLTVRLVDRGE
jgi:hypothetical protein